MRKSSAMMMAIMLIAFGSMFAAGGSMLKPLAHDADVGKELTRMLGYRQDIPEGSKVRVIRRQGGEERLAGEGLGVWIRLTPTDSVALRQNGLRLLARRVAQECVGQYPGVPVEWIEVQFDWKDAKGKETAVRTLYETEGGRIVSQARPSLPVSLGPPPKPRVAKAPAPPEDVKR